MIYEKLLKLGTDYQKHTQSAKIVQLAVEGVEQLEVWFGQYLPQFFYSMIASITSFAILAFLNLKMAIILLVCVPLIPLAIVAVQKIAKRILKKYWAQYANLADNFLENLQGLTTLEIYSADEFKQNQMMEEAEHFKKVTMKVLSMQLNSIIIMDIVAYGGAGLGIAAVVSSFFGGTLSLENCFICILLSADFFIPLRRLGSYFHTAMNGTTASNNIFELLDTQEKTDGSLLVDFSNQSNQENKLNQKNVLYEAKNLSYSFGERNVLNDVNLKIQSGSFTAFVGKSGSGKSTLLKLFMHFWNADSGKVEISKTSVQKINTNCLRKIESYVTQETVLFHDTIENNIRIAKLDATEDEIINACKKAELHDFIMSLPQKYKTQVAELGDNFSGGERQRLGLARAFLHKSDFILLDEPTSNLDNYNEEKIMESVKKESENKTIVIVSHRDSTFKFADKIFKLNAGRNS